jgi:hypothetical protein
VTRVKCPHCGAGNREGREVRICWQCGKDLWAPVERHTYAIADMPEPSETTAYDPDAFPAPVSDTGASPAWKLWLAIGFAVVSLLALVYAINLYLTETSAPV